MSEKETDEAFKERDELRGDALRMLEKGEFKTALRSYSEYLKRTEAVEDTDNVAEALNSIGLIHVVRGNDDEALEFYNRALKLASENGLEREEARSFHNLGTFFERQGKNKEALSYLFRSLAIQKEAEIEGSETEEFIRGLRKTLKLIPFQEVATEAYASLDEKVKAAIDIESFAGDHTVRNEDDGPGRNDPCTCGSGKKYKKCCGA